eukprot:TRINITY_DN4847_c0_g1_i1.p1 TRINITY_DN4847_c0_g1~~TRINITY_DN4847_c0_g1_i1.p1  ORF type:complete len:741 (-),score=227.90 TRINITY_DN4847_c0_g1_i1:199-2421(-)
MSEKESKAIPKEEPKQADKKEEKKEKPQKQQQKQQKPKKEKGDNKEAKPKKEKGDSKEAKPAVKKEDLKVVEDKSYEYRAKLWDELKKKRAEEKHESKTITVTLKDGTKMEAKSWVDSPIVLAKKIASVTPNECMVAKVNEDLWDLTRPLEGDCKMELFTFDSKEGQHVFWHSSSHILGESIESYYPGAKLTIGPALEDGGFYYDCYLPDSRVIQPEPDFENIQHYINDVIKERQKFERLVVTKKEALEMFKDNKYKVELISSKVADTDMCTAYRCGRLIDLCRGPHLPDTSRVKAMMVNKCSSVYWLSDKANDSLQRIYGISFPDKNRLAKYDELMKAAAERDHRKLGPSQKLFMFHELSPGSAFFLPMGTRIYNKLINFMRTQYYQRGYDEVISPNVFNCDLWRTSGHYQNYKDNMFLFEVEKKEFALKPMNCPGHCLMYANDLHSYRDLPLRYADFGVLHRNEFSGALSGLTRVRRFQQDDAHIFCRPDQIEQEVFGVLNFIKYVYGVFGFEFAIQLSTMPDKHLGEVSEWEYAEKQLKACLDKFGKKWEENPKDGAFYGPKIDIQLFDALKRKHQCATVQLDFQMPKRFNLSFKNNEGKLITPVMVHRAILGSVERMMAVLIEHTGGNWPFWLSPRQVLVATVSEKFQVYGEKIRKLLHDAGYYTELDDSDANVGKKVREAFVAHWNYLIIVGEDEVKANTVTVCSRENRTKQDTMTAQEALAMFAKMNMPPEPQM